MLELRPGHAGRDRLRLGRLQLGLGLRNIGLVAAVPAAYWFRVMRSDSANASAEYVEQALQLVGDAQLQIIAGERALRRKPGIGQIGGARLRGGDIGLDRAADLTPEIGGPARRDIVAEKASDAAAAADHERMTSRSPLEALPPLRERCAWRRYGSGREIAGAGFGDDFFRLRGTPLRRP